MMLWWWALVLRLGMALVGYGVSVVRGGGLPLGAQRVEMEDFAVGISPPPCFTKEDIQRAGNVAQVRLPGPVTVWTTSDTGSMRPALGDFAVLVTVPLEFCPAVPERIIIFKDPLGQKDRDGNDVYYVHRIHRVGVDDQGPYWITKADNQIVAWGPDTWLVRREMIQGVAVLSSK
jgi:hypothetical protein